MQYGDFVDKMVYAYRLVSKECYIVVPYVPPYVQLKGASLAVARYMGRPQTQAKDWEKASSEMALRVGMVASALRRRGMAVHLLDNEELLDFLNSCWNPSLSDVQKPQLTPRALAAGKARGGDRDG